MEGSSEGHWLIDTSKEVQEPLKLGKEQNVIVPMLVCLYQSQKERDSV